MEEAKEEKNQIVKSLEFRIRAGETELAQQRARLESIKNMVPSLEARIHQLLGAISELQSLRGFAVDNKWPSEEVVVERKTEEPPK